MGNISTLLNKIQPAVYFEKTVTENRTSKNTEFLNKVTEIQIKKSVEAVIERSIILREMIENKEVGLIGAFYNIETGEVNFLEETFMFGEIKHFYLDVNGQAQTNAATAE
jgi:carbonic anhydrase